jgi:nucleotide-binding universal stress UspA family protein
MKVLITTDGNEAAQHAIASAIRLLPLLTAEVRLVSVLDPEARIGANEDAAADLTRGAAQLLEAGVTAEAVERRGHFAEAILAEAERWGADVIVVGSEGRRGLARWLGGSVSDDVIHGWRGAVLVVKHP